MMQKLIHILTTRFFENDYPEPVRKQFYLWMITNDETHEKENLLQDIWDALPETVDLASLAELHKVNRRIRAHSEKIRLLKIVAAAAIIILPLLGITGKWMNTSYQPDTIEATWMTGFAPNGERKMLTLPDGSTVWLNAGSTLFYPETWDSHTRTLFLTGEAHFSVAKDAERPFVVRTSHMEIEALGTVFSVQDYPDDENVTTTLESGSVRVSDISRQAKPIVLTTNEQAVYHTTGASLTKRPVDATRINSWTQGYLIFQQESMSNIFRALERKYNVKINYRDSKFAEISLTVRFRDNESLTEALDILNQIGANFHYKVTDKDIYIN
jgi:ferric-dicitrate binding protein FerR (iron transport regulator)